MELLMVTVVIGTLSTMIAPSLQRVRERAMVSAAMVELRIIDAELRAYLVTNFELPVSLALIDRATLNDPWGKPYVYVSVNGGSPKHRTRSYDLSSAGPDGADEDGTGDDIFNW